jgi:TonB family protein
MKNLVFLLITISFAIDSSAQESITKSDTIYTVNDVSQCARNKKCKNSDQKDSMSCMMNTLLNHTVKNLQYPEDARENGVGGRVYVNFVIEKDGSISNAKVVKSIWPSLDAEALRVVQLFSGFDYPALIDDNRVRMRVTMPISFRIQ